MNSQAKTDPTQTLAELLAPIRRRIPDTNDLSNTERDRVRLLAALDAVLAVVDELEDEAQDAFTSAQYAGDIQSSCALEGEGEALHSASERIRQVVHTALDGGGS